MKLVSLTYTIPYIILVSLCFLFDALLKDKRSNNIGNIFLLIVLIFLFGLRGHLGTDFINYKILFDEMPNPIDLDLNSYTIEKGYIIYTSILKLFFNNYYLWVLVNVIIDFSILYYCFKKYSLSIFLSWAFFLTFTGLVIEINLFRNIKAILLFLISIQYLIQRDALKYVGINIIGAFFHTSALAYIPLYFIISKKYNVKIYIILFIIVNFVYFYGSSFSSTIINSVFGTDIDSQMANKLLGYSNNSDESYGLSFGYLEKTIGYIVSVYYLCKKDGLKGFNIVFANSFVIYYTVLFLFSDVYVLAERFSYLFSFSYWFIFPNIIKSLRSNNQVVVIFMIYLICMFKTVTSTRKFLWKYDNIIFGIESYEVRKNRYFGHDDI